MSTTQTNNVQTTKTITTYAELPAELQQYFDDAKLREFYKLGVDREISMQVLQDYLVELYNNSLSFKDDTLEHKITTFTFCIKASIANGRFNKANSLRAYENRDLQIISNGTHTPAIIEPSVTIPVNILNGFVSKCIEEIVNYSSLHNSQVEIVIDSLETAYADIIRVYRS